MNKYKVHSVILVRGYGLTLVLDRCDRVFKNTKRATYNKPTYKGAYRKNTTKLYVLTLTGIIEAENETEAKKELRKYVKKKGYVRLKKEKTTFTKID